MKILFVVNYYYPYISGLSEYVRTIAEEMVKRGNQCVVLCSNHNKLPEKELINGVQVCRTPIVCKISKGTVSPQFITEAVKMSKKFDIVNLHLPMLEAGIISRMVNPEKLVIMYHCDIHLPKSFINKIIVGIMDVSHKMALKRARHIIVSTFDYAVNARYLGKYRYKMTEAYCPIKESIEKKALEIREKKEKRSNDLYVIGFCGRIVEEKGIDILLKAYEIVKGEIPNVSLKIVGEYKNVAGGSIYDELIKYIKQNRIEGIEFLGGKKPSEVVDFYSSIDVLALPSINPLEAFGTVQVEAMISGTPVVVSDLPGLRTVVPKTGMGLVCKRNDAKDLAKCLILILKNREKYIKPYEEIKNVYGKTAVADIYQKCFEKGRKNT